MCDPARKSINETQDEHTGTDDAGPQALDQVPAEEGAGFGRAAN
jgi:hypothetical protein